MKALLLKMFENADIAENADRLSRHPLVETFENADPGLGIFGNIGTVSAKSTKTVPWIVLEFEPSSSKAAYPQLKC